MDRLANYRTTIEKVLTEHTRVPFAYGQIELQLAFDRERDHYIVMLVGEDHAGKRVDGPLIHVDLVDGKAWIQRDGTEDGVTQQLIQEGISPDDIVLTWGAFAPMTAREAMAA
jgi:hypothetical protein